MSILGFTPLFDVLLDEYGVYTAAVYGKIWRYCDWSKDGICDASNARLAEELGISAKTVQREKSRLEGFGYLEIERRDRQTDLVRVRHDAVVVLVEQPPHMGGDTQSSDYGLPVHTPMDTQSTKDSIIDTTDTISSVEERNPFDNIADTFDEQDAVETFESFDERSFPEPRYEDDPFEDESAKRHPKWKVPKNDLQQRALQACGRQYFASRNERAEWNKIERSAVSWYDLPDAVMHIEWIEDKIAYVQEQNLNYRKNKLTHASKYRFPALLSMINNEEYRHDWLSRMRGEHEKSRA